MTRRRLAILVLAIAVTLTPLAARAQGLLIPTDESLAPLELSRHRVDLRIEDHAAVTHVTQVFTNRTYQVLEATYYFAVPAGAVTTDFALWMNGERISGQVLERDQARAVYQNIVRRLRDPGLLEYIDATLFQASIFPIPAQGEQTVEIEFASVLPQVGNMLHYVYPIHESTGATLPSLVVSGDLVSSQEIATVYSPHHEIEVDRQDAHRVHIGLEASGAPVNRDLSLFIGLTGDEVGFSLLTYDPDGSEGQQGYFMMTLSPSEYLDDSAVLPKQVTFVVDTSGSMRGDKLSQAQDLLRYCVEHLMEQDLFNIVSFSTRIRPAFDEPVAATSANRQAALEFIDDLRARGNTNISGALERALAQAGTPERPQLVLFVTDGLPTEGETDVATIVEAVQTQAAEGYRRLFSFGVGYDVNTRLIEGIARSGRGRTGYVRPQENLREVIGQFYDQVSAPIMTDLHVDFGAMQAADIYPQDLPDLYRGEQLTLFGRYKTPLDSTVIVQGETTSASKTLTYEATLAGDDRTADRSRSFVGSLWAHRRISALLDEINDQGESRQRIDEVVSLATHWGIVTPYTSYLAVDPSETMGPVAQRQFDMVPPADAVSTTPDGAGWNNRPLRTRTADRPSLDGDGGSLGVTAEAPMASASGDAGPRTLRERDRRPGDEGVRFAHPMRGSGGLSAVTGTEAVEAAIQDNESRERLVLADQVQASRQAAGRTFTQDGGIWVQQGLSDRGVDRTITYLSDEYFALMTDHPELNEVLALGDRIRFELGVQVIEIRP